jgi:hypothetical protein
LWGAQRIWAVAAIDAAARRLVALHDAISQQFAEGDRLVYLGNYIGGGDAVLATVDELLDFRRRVLGRRHGLACDVVFLRGAQEEMWQKLLQLQFAPNPREVLQWTVGAGMEPTIRAYGGDLRQGLAAARDSPRTIARWTSALRSAMNATPGHRALFSALHHAAFTEERSLLFVHASVDPARQLAAQGDALWWGRGDILELATPFEGFGRVVRGVGRHRPAVVERAFAASLGGVGQDGRLVAACFGVDGTVLDIIET